MKENDYILIEDLDSLSPAQKQQLLTLFKFLDLKPTHMVSLYLNSQRTYEQVYEILAVYGSYVVGFTYKKHSLATNRITKSELEKYLALINFEDNGA